ncbi:hypothetical protein [Staphylococcus shinii]|uniref:hypothetical protein n=1 Tax=Staphylococcus shinii TaxID=2912228 RepID=UPI003CF4106D
MKIRDLNLDDYVIVYDIGKSEHSKGMTVVGRVIELEFREDDDNMATIDSMGSEYEITDDNYFDLWPKYIEDKTEHIGKRQSNDVQQRKRNKKIVQWSDDIKLKFIERVIQDLSPLAAYHIGNAIDVLAVAESKEDIEQARWSIQRAFENWDVK